MMMERLVFPQSLVNILSEHRLFEKLRGPAFGSSTYAQQASLFLYRWHTCIVNFPFTIEISLRGFVRPGKDQDMAGHTWLDRWRLLRRRGRIDVVRLDQPCEMRDEIQHHRIVAAGDLHGGLLTKDEYLHHVSRPVEALRFVLLSPKIGFALWRT
ncbi:hypothetical protein BOO69_02290 [Sulfitobacter alexandrii]|uniref:Uncharacterized protein n=2 Tax=Sulfitobacter alexandrii TaxID=1917485 RepID=A0A1J0WDJ5_9RHOB|nr:hypothetical protein BOO69_02290 [Sulfitobacter alexandrii]